MNLTADIIRNLTVKKKRYSVSDGRGLMLEIHPTGAKSWAVRYWQKGKESRQKIGNYPEMSIREAREITARIKNQVERGEVINPTPPEQITFRHVAEEWFNVRIADKSDGHSEKTKVRLKHLYGAIGDMPIDQIRPRDILTKCRELEAQGKTDTAQRIRSLASQVFTYAISSDICETNPAISLRGALRSHKKEHYATITKPEDMAELICKMNKYHGSNIVRIALLFSALTFARPGEIRQAEWAEIKEWAEIGAYVGTWTIPPEKTKMKREHIIPLGSWTIKLLAELRKITGGQRWLFPSERRDGRPMSDGTVRVALRKMGYTKEQITAHGLRAMASTALNQAGFRSDIIEAQLAHQDRNAVRNSYNHADYMEERKTMMNRWNMYLYDMLSWKDKEKRRGEIIEALASGADSDSEDVFESLSDTDYYSLKPIEERNADILFKER